MNPQIVITVNQAGQVQIQANIDNPIFLLGLLESAKQAIHSNAGGKANGQRIMPAAADALNQLQG